METFNGREVLYYLAGQRAKQDARFGKGKYGIHRDFLTAEERKKNICISTGIPSNRIPRPRYTIFPRKLRKNGGKSKSLSWLQSGNILSNSTIYQQREIDVRKTRPVEKIFEESKMSPCLFFAVYTKTLVLYFELCS